MIKFDNLIFLAMDDASLKVSFEADCQSPQDGSDISDMHNIDIRQ